MRCEGTRNIDGKKVRDVLTALPTLVEAAHTLTASGMLPKTVAVPGTIGRSATQSFDNSKASKAASRPLGIFGIMRELMPLNVSRALDFFVGVATAYGQSLKRE